MTQKEQIEMLLKQNAELMAQMKEMAISKPVVKSIETGVYLEGESVTVKPNHVAIMVPVVSKPTETKGGNVYIAKIDRCQLLDKKDRVYTLGMFLTRSK